MNAAANAAATMPYGPPTSTAARGPSVGTPGGNATANDHSNPSPCSTARPPVGPAHDLERQAGHDLDLLELADARAPAAPTCTGAR